MAGLYSEQAPSLVNRPILDLDLLRTLVILAEEASFTKTARRVGRSQSAITLQIQKLEDLVRTPLVARAKGAPVELTPHGAALVETARAMLALNDSVFLTLDAAALPERVRLASSSTYIPFYLQRTLDEMRVRRPNLTVEVTEGYSCQIAPEVKDGAFDLVVCEGNHEPRGWPVTEVWRGRLRWIGAANGAAHRLDPVPLSLPPGNCPWKPPWLEDCFWRSAAVRTLERNGVAHRIVAAASSMEGLYAPVLAGEAVTITHGGAVPRGLRALGDDEGLPLLPEVSVVLFKSRSAPQPGTDLVAETICSNFRLG
jgi:DNA-binding transcriptional LysR family regulator